MRIWLAVLVAGLLAGCGVYTLPNLGASADQPAMVHKTSRLKSGDMLMVSVNGSLEVTVVSGIGLDSINPNAKLSGEKLSPSSLSGTYARDGARVTALATDVVATYDVPPGPVTLHFRVTALKTPITVPPALDPTATTDHIFVVVGGAEAAAVPVEATEPTPPLQPALRRPASAEADAK